ncbi:MAG: hypothetical protein JXM73_05640 [Anaerolineae bacterium]|nr:hypothetical protein [Anaerolineae bacterium]
MNDKPISARPLVLAAVIVLVLRLLAGRAPVGLAGDGYLLNQTVPTFTPTPSPVTPSPTSVIGPTSAPRTPTPKPGVSATPMTATQTPLPGLTQPGLTATPSPTGSEVAVTPDATLLPPENATPSPEASADLPTPGVGEPGATPLPTPEAPGPAASPTGMQAQSTLPPWTPAVGGTGTASGSSCIWPVAGLLLIVVGALLLVWRGRQNKRQPRT